MAMLAVSLSATLATVAARAAIRTDPPTAKVYENTIRGITVRIPEDYKEFNFKDTGFSVRAFADDLRPYGPRTAPDYPRNILRVSLTVSVGVQRRFTGRDYVGRGIKLRAEGRMHLPAEPATTLDGPGGPAVSEGLSYYRAAAGPAPASGTREDMFVPREVRRAPDGEVLPEAIFCLSRDAPIVRSRAAAIQDQLSCEWMLTWRDIEVSIHVDRQHLTRWRELRSGVLALLDGFVVAGPAEAGPPSEPLFPSPPTR